MHSRQGHKHCNSCWNWCKQLVILRCHLQKTLAHSHSRLAGWLCAWYCSSLLVGKRPCSGGLWLRDHSHRALIEASTGNNTLVLLPLVAQLGCGRQLCRKEVDIWSYSRHQWRRTTQWLTERYPASASKRFYHSISLVHAAEMTTLLRWRHST